MRKNRSTRIAALAALAATSAAAFVTAVVVSAPGSSAATCSDVEVLFARGTGEAQGLGSVGPTFISSIKSALPGKSVATYAVVYDADTAQSSGGAGSRDLVNHLIATAGTCAGTSFILGGYSQGATVVDKALGIQTQTGGTGTTIPSNLSSRVASAVAFGNPLGLQRQTIATASATYGSRSKDYCNTGDPVCGNGSNTAAHLQYVSNGSAAAGGTFAARLVPSASPTPTPTPTTGPTGSPTSTPTTPAAVCVRASTRAHVAAGRANELFGRAYAVGSRDSLGRVSSFTFVSLRQDGSGWDFVGSC